ncbi:VPLPA-CTERM sorting domain-containing protein [Methylomonas sp. LL1]|uniref:VPLPA-CTERM sorting domain-containing protein n=1 Tax=Methylomonas sp. LL1 TaxID=2785785 RepID=UPI0018C3785A|nr:VPLPA-CTERM sorting domain-containing protein [Methylomonas sp. LL1]QPK62370.1 VPLPA-CTERM sorting domain-containing protein [Methylomonas sp. LL1]
MLKQTALTIILILVNTLAQASPITFTFSGIGDLTLNGTNHNNTAFTVTLNADNVDVQPPPTLPTYVNLSGTIDLGDLGTATFDNLLYIYSSQDGGFAGFGDNDKGDLFGLFDNGFLTYDLISDFGPLTVGVSDVDDPLQWIDVETSLGKTTFENFTTATFSATVSAVPLPASAWLFGSAVVGMIGFVRRKNS